ncbi:MAG: PilZ domain-containing protein [Verrucomicrobiota bacterium]|nr:PilZ domain-containing protein [Verrucomicrobiota bacterium]
MVALLKMPNRFSDEASGAERRVFPRKEVSGHVESRRVDHTIEAQRNPRLSLTLRDLSLGGLSAISDVPVNAGERLAVFFPPQGATRGWDAAGRVIRCQPSGMGYRVALEFEQLPMAA